MKKINQKILIIAAHPDDEVLGCGGTIAKYSEQGAETYCLFLGKGKASRFQRSEEIKELKEEQIILEKEAQRASEVLGFSEIFFEDFPDQKYDTVPLLDIVRAIERIKEKVKPEIIFTHYIGDLNLDHQITLRTTLTASRPLQGERVRKIYSFEIPSSTEWGESSFKPNVFVDIKETFDKKVEALKAYKSEVREYPHPRSPKGLEIIARRWGIAVGKELVEPFELIRKIK